MNNKQTILFLFSILYLSILTCNGQNNLTSKNNKMILDQEEKFKDVLSKIEGKINEQSFFNTFLELYPEVWKKHKTMYSKFNRSKQFGQTIPLPKPEVSLRKEIRVWLRKQQTSN